MRCPNCGTKYKGKKCPECGRHTDPSLEAKQHARIALLVVVLVIVAALAFYFLAVHNFYQSVINIIRSI